MELADGNRESVLVVVKGEKNPSCSVRVKALCACHEGRYARDANTACREAESRRELSSSGHDKPCPSRVSYVTVDLKEKSEATMRERMLRFNGAVVRIPPSMRDERACR